MFSHCGTPDQSEDRSQILNKGTQNKYRVESIRIRSFSGPYSLAFGRITERYGAFLRIQSKCGKIRTRKTPNTDTSTLLML